MRRTLHRVLVIVNPSAGTTEPILAPLNRVLRRSGAEWAIRVTRGFGDARQFALEGADAGVDAVLLYGGDGTIMEVAGALAGSEIPMGIIPGGSANVVATELRLPTDPETACAQILGDAAIRSMDLGELASPDDASPRLFIARVGMGFDARMVRSARSDGPNRLGIAGYWLAAVRQLQRTPVTRYQLVLDERQVEVSGVMCAVTNVGNIGYRSLRLAPRIRVDDGLLDVVVWRNNSAGSILRTITGMLTGRPDPAAVCHWQAKTIEVDAEPRQQVETDGEAYGQMPLRIRVVPSAVRVLVPR